MCSPAAAAGVQLAGGMYSAYQQRQAGKMEQSYYNMLATNADKQAEAAQLVAGNKVTAIQNRAAFDSGSLKDQVKGVEGSQKVELAAAGVGAGSVTAEDIARDTMTKAAMDEALIRYNADMASDETLRQGKFEALDLKNQAIGYRMAGKNARRTAKTNSYSTLLGASTQAASTWYTGNRYKKG